MPYYGKRSKERLATCHKDLQVIFNTVIKDFDNSIIEGTRSKEDQNRYYDEGKSRIRWPNGKHNKTPSMAVDAVPWPEAYGDIKKMILFAGYVLCTADRLLATGQITHKLTWGGDWDSDHDLSDQKFIDYPHFELRAK